MSVVGLAVPNLNQGMFLQAALDSIHSTRHVVRLAVTDAGSTDTSRDVLAANAHRLAYWRSHADAGQAAAINEGIAALDGQTPRPDLVGWLNADDLWLPGGLDTLVDALDAHPDWVAVTAGGRLADADGVLGPPIETQAFDPETFSTRCTICQPASLVRASAWRAIGGLDAHLQMCFDYDLWWRLSHQGPIGHLPDVVAVSRDHPTTKTRRLRPTYFAEATAIVRRERGEVPWHWFISEALEREAGYAVGVRPPLGRRLRAAASAITAFVAARATRTH